MRGFYQSYVRHCEEPMSGDVAISTFTRRHLHLAQVQVLLRLRLAMTCNLTENTDSIALRLPRYPDRAL